MYLPTFTIKINHVGESCLDALFPDTSGVFVSLPFG